MDKNKQPLKYTALIFALILLIHLFGCSSNTDLGRLTALSFSHGGYPDETWFFEITPVPDAPNADHINFRAYGYNGVEMDLDVDMGPEEGQIMLNEIAELIESNNIHKWRTIEDVFPVDDGGSIYLLAEYENGSLELHIDEWIIPESYEEGYEALVEYLHTTANILQANS